MGNVSRLVRHLIDPSNTDARDNQLAFYNDPHGVCTKLGLKPEEVALIFSMNESAIKRRTKAEGDDLTTLIDDYIDRMVSQWPPMGTFAPDPWTDPASCSRSREEGERVGSIVPSGIFRSFWSRPWPSIGYVSQGTATKGETIESFILGGEGFLPGATVQFVHHSNNLPVITYTTAPDASGYRCCNFRRTYLRIPDFKIPRDANEGEHSPFVFNPNTSAHIHGNPGTVLMIKS